MNSPDGNLPNPGRIRGGDQKLMVDDATARGAYAVEENPPLVRMIIGDREISLGTIAEISGIIATEKYTETEPETEKSSSRAVTYTICTLVFLVFATLCAVSVISALQGRDGATELVDVGKLLLSFLGGVALASGSGVVRRIRNTPKPTRE